jgi:hypothetical protein
MQPKTLKNFTCYVDGRGYAGRINEIQLPNLTLKTEEHRAGGMDAPIEVDLGMEALTCELTFAEYDPALFGLFGLVEGANVGLTLRGAQQGTDGSVEAVIVTLRGGFKQLNAGTWTGGSKATLTASVSASYYRLQIGAATVVEIDIENMVRRIGGTDQLSGVRRALGI